MYTQHIQAYIHAYTYTCIQWNLSITDKLVAEVLSFIRRLSFLRGHGLIPIYVWSTNDRKGIAGSQVCVTNNRMVRNRRVPKLLNVLILVKYLIPRQPSYGSIYIPFYHFINNANELRSLVSSAFSVKNNRRKYKFLCSRFVNRCVFLLVR